MEQIEQNQPLEEPASLWESPQACQQTPESAQYSPFSLQDVADSSTQRRSPPARVPFALSSGKAPDQGALIESLLGSLEGAAHMLATAEGAHILPLALQAFLALCRARRGVVLLRPARAALSRIEARQHISGDLAERFTLEPGLWAVPPGSVVFVLAGDEAAELTTPERFASLSADVGARWYAWLPLALPEGGQAALVALGDGEPPAAGERGWLRLAGGVLGYLVAARLECDQLHQALAQKERARAEFIGLASHELRSPLTVIKGYAQLLLRQAQRGKQAGDIDLAGLEAINQQVSRMSHLVAELLDFSRIEQGTLEVIPTPVDVIALARHVVEQRQRVLPDVAFHLAASEPRLIALADRSRLEQVLGYLLDNAARFGQEEGVVDVTVQRARTTLPPSSRAFGSPDEAEAAQQGEVALISVRDYGPGLPDGEREKLFTAFYRGPEHSLQRQLAGLGLSLYLSRYLVARQHGWLWADFPVAGDRTGSIFHLAFPVPSASSGE